MMPHGVHSLCFLNRKGCRAPCHALTCHSRILFIHTSLCIFCPFSDQIFKPFLLLSFESSLYILSTSPLLNMWFADIFFQSLQFVFFLLHMAFFPGVGQVGELYLFSYFAASGLSCGIWAFPYFSTTIHGQQLWHMGLGVKCPATCGLLVPSPWIKPMSPVLEGRFLTTGPPGKSPRGLSHSKNFKFR